jgi:hypothetical protein
MAGFLNLESMGEGYPGRAFLSVDAVLAVMPVKTKGKFGVQVFTSEGLSDPVLPERYDTLKEAWDAADGCHCRPTWSGVPRATAGAVETLRQLQ